MSFFEIIEYDRKICAAVMAMPPRERDRVLRDWFAIDMELDREMEDG